ncbi:MAG: hypothetical protein HC844_09060 [Tabrizicola sp.]|nr:hypothetical protein [Tabrizicola sp.]
MRLTRRATLLACLVLFPLRLGATVCEPVMPGLMLCDAQGWTLQSVEGGTAIFTSEEGITGTVTLKTGLDAEAEVWANWQQSHAPISARAVVLDTAFVEIDGRLAARSAWLPRHVDHPTVVAMTGQVGDGLALAVTTSASAETFDNTHRDAHERLCAALKLDRPG